jgi:hypothetical protein
MAPSATSTNGHGNGSGHHDDRSTAAALGEDCSAPMNAREVAGLSDEEIYSLAQETFVLRSRQDALLCLLGGELDRRQGWKASGATSLAAWLQQRFGLSAGSARTYAKVGEHLIDLPHLAHSLARGQVSLDKAKVLAGVARPQDDADWAEAAGELSFKDLRALVRSKRVPSRACDVAEQDQRSVRFNDTSRTMVAQLPTESYVALRSVLEKRAKKMDSDGHTPFDQRLADALVSCLRPEGAHGSSGAPLVVAHVPYEVLADPDSSLPGELEGAGLISAEVARRLACDATVIVALDDALGHTMYEGRARRFPTEAQRREVFRRDRHCVFPGCANVLFTNCHHIEAWKPGGLTDLSNLALLCEYHHHLIHSKQWSMEGDADVELRFIGPTGQVMTSRPSRLWAQVSDPVVLAGRRAGTQETTTSLSTTESPRQREPEKATKAPAPKIKSNQSEKPGRRSAERGPDRGG